MSEQEYVGTTKQVRFFLKCCDPGVYFVYHAAFDLFEFNSGSFTKETTLGYAYGKLLEHLVCSAGIVVSREQLFSVAWPDRVVTQNSLNQAIFYLRQLFGDVDGRVIKTIPRRGYVFNPDHLLSNSDSVVDELEQKFNALSHQPVDTLQVDEVLKEPSHGIGSANNSRVDASLLPSMPVLRKKPVSKELTFKYGLIVFFLVVALAFIYRLYYLLEEQTWFDTKLDVSGEQSVLFVGGDAEDLKKMQLATKVLKQRFFALNHNKSYLIFNKMHSYIDIVCVTPKNQGKFILAHENRVDSISDEQISECVK